MIDVDISEKTANRLHSILEGMGVAEEKVLKPALARGLSAGKTVFSKQIKEVYNIDINKLTTRYARFGYKNVSTEGNEIIGSIAFSGGAIPLYKFKVSPTEVNNGKIRNKVTTAVFRSGSGDTLNDAFIAQMKNNGKNHMGVFERKGEWEIENRKTKKDKKTENNEKIKQLFGPSLSRMAQNAVVLESVEERVNEVINQRIEHEIERLLSGNGG